MDERHVDARCGTCSICPKARHREQPAPVLTRLATTTVRHRRPVLVAAAVFFALAGAVGGGVADELSSGGFEDPGAESYQADAALLDELGAATPNVVLLVSARSGSVDDPAVATAGSAITERLHAEGLTDVFSYWSLGAYPALRNDDGDKALVLGRVEGSDDEVNEVAADLVPELDALDDAAVDVEVGGFAAVFREVGSTIEDDLLRAEMIAIPITLILLLVVFGSVVSATLPLAIAALSVVGTFLVLRVLSEVTEVSVFALNMTTAMGLGLAIDYSLFIVSRYREELRAGHAPDVAVVRTVRTAGRTVTFSAATVATSLLALLVFPLAFLRSFAYAGVAVSLLAGAFSVVVLPALLAVIGRRVDTLTLWQRSTRAVEDGFWHRAALFVMKRPLPIATAVISLLLFLGAPFLGIELGLPDDRVLPESAATRGVHDTIRSEFSAKEAGAMSVVATDIGDPIERRDEIGEVAARLSRLEGVTEVRSIAGVFAAGEQVVPPNDLLARFAAPDATFLSVVPSVEPMSTDGEDLVEAVRATDAPFDFKVTGVSAQLVDAKAGLFSRMPLALTIIAAVTFGLLFLMFGSVVIPLKAVVLNLLSLSATFGAMVWVFQEGNLAEVLAFTPGAIDASTPILMFCIAFGISMDYEVFLLSRIKEEHDRGASNTLAVARGLERTGRIVTAAALLIAVVFIAFATSDVRFIKLFGIGLALAVLVDAYLIRGTLVPAFMRLAGEWNWWAPGWLRRAHDRVGITDHVDLDGDEVESRSPGWREERPLVAQHAR
jgi:RND superfamily putative drug exporter